MNQIDPIARVLQAARCELLALPNVVATGIGFKRVGGRTTDEIAIVCSVERKIPRAELAPAALVPRTVEGIATDVVQTGRIRALGVARGGAPTDRFRPAPGGVSIGHASITAGTLGCLVRRDGDVFILSNNHVLADSNRARPGDPIVQPGPFDGGSVPTDTIAALESFVPVRLKGSESGCALANAAAALGNAAARLLGSSARLKAVSTEVPENLVDAAIARPLDPALVESGILGIGEPSGTALGTLGMPVVKSGRTTGVTRGTIEQVSVTVDVDYGIGIARFTDQMMAGAMSQGGDSGSAVLDSEGRVVGLLFAGSENTTVINRIQHVLDAFGVAIP